MGQISQPQHIYAAAGENEVFKGRKPMLKMFILGWILSKSKRTTLGFEHFKVFLGMVRSFPRKRRRRNF
jgi:hypothetical protein